MKPTKKKVSSQYDKIVKENLEAIIPRLIERVLGIHAIFSEEIPDDLQHTKERKPDALKRITDQTGATFILHVEFQVADEPKMVHRMHNYCAMLLERYELPVKQFVLYLGNKLPKMATNIKTEDLSFRYQLISFQQLDYKLFTTSDNPEDILLGILANFGQVNPVIVVQEIIQRLAETASGPLALEKYIAQLRILVQLRQLKPILETVMDTLAKYINEQNDPFFIKGRQEGKREGKAEAQRLLIKNLLTETVFSSEQIARLAGVSIDFVEKLR